MVTNVSLTSFNSTLVQLKASAEELRFIIVAMFQFYLSSIKSINLRVTKTDYNKFQFYLSSIKSEKLAKLSENEKKFQFYLSSIKSYDPQ